MKTKLTSIVLLFWLCSATAAFGQLLDFSSKKSPEKFNPELVPRSASMAGAIFPIRLSENPAFKYVPYEVVTAWGLNEIGFDPMLLKQITWAFEAPTSLDSDIPPAWALVLHFEKIQGLSDNVIGSLNTRTIGGKTVYAAPSPDEPSYLIFDESTIIVGTEPLFESMLTADGRSDLVQLANSSKVNGQLLAFIDVKSLRGLLHELMSKAEKEVEMPPAIADLRQIPDLLKSIELGTDAEGQLETKLILHANDPQAAEELSEILAAAAQFIKQTALTEMAENLDLNDPVEAATLQYTNRVWQKYETKLTPEIEGADLTIVFHEEILALPYVTAMFGMGSEKVFIEKVTPDRQLKETALAFHNYADAYGKFPATIKSEDGRPLFSARVAMLPFMEQLALYQKLKLDEAWDSPHNSEITSIVIPAFSDPTGQSDSQGTIQFPVYPGSIWDEDNPSTGFADIKDGTSNTILAISAPAEAVNGSWADPKPWRISAANPMADVFGNRDEVHVVMADGATQLLKRSEMNNDKLKALLTRDGGEVIEN